MKENGNYRVRSYNGNDYLFCRSIPQVLPLHPVLNHLLEIREKGIDLKKWLDGLDDEGAAIDVGDENAGPSFSKFPKDEIGYYYDYLIFLEESGYFQDLKKIPMTPGNYSGEMVKRYLANTPQIIFETTSACNLACRYCAYGDLYDGYKTGCKERESRNLDTGWARNFLDYMLELYNSPLNQRLQKKISLAFYGGEPLLNMPLIKDIVEYSKSKKLPWNPYLFSMTTNGVELDKHMDFLAENKFMMLVSLDGNEKNNSYRVFKNGEASHGIVFRNLVALKKKYPGYFEKYVTCVSVIHNRNSRKEVRAYFHETLGIEPVLLELNNIGVNVEKQAEFDGMFKKMFAGTTPEELVKENKGKKTSGQDPFARRLSKFLRTNCGNVVSQYDQLMQETRDLLRVQTGTCHPFEQKVFITADGKILPCERIRHDYTLGNVNGDGVFLDFDKIAEKYNGFYAKIAGQCNRCFATSSCPVCIFNLNLMDETCNCDSFQDKENFETEARRSISLLEETPGYYPRIMKGNGTQ